MKRRKGGETPEQKNERQKKRNQDIMTKTSETIKASIEQELEPWVRPWYSAGQFRNTKTGHQ